MNDSRTVGSAADKTIERGRLVMRFDPMIKELRAFARSINDQHLDKSVPHRLGELASELDRFRTFTTANATPLSWGVAQGQPLLTKRNDGGHHPGRKRVKRPYSLFGAVCYKWDIETWHPDAHHKRNSEPFEFFVLNNASIEISIRRVKGVRTTTSASWRFEVGNHESPGVHFHTQSNLNTQDVPRLPTSLFAPTDALEFVLGELFQDDWRRRAASYDLGEWRKYQVDRMVRVLTWQAEQVRDARGSPWIGLKVAKPLPSLLIR